MKSLKTLVRARQRVLDEKRRALNLLEEQEDRLNDGRSALAAEQLREAENVRNSKDGGFGYGSYLTGARMRDQAIQFGLLKLGGEIESARDEIAEAYAEIKRFELIEAAQIERARKGEARREQEELDELGLGLYRRNSAATG